nr:patatin-like protein 3 [Ipomoea batatas]
MVAGDVRSRQHIVQPFEYLMPIFADEEDLIASSDNTLGSGEAHGASKDLDICSLKLIGLHHRFQEMETFCMIWELSALSEETQAFRVLLAHHALELKSVDDRTKISAIGSGVAMNNLTAAVLAHVLNNKHELPFSVSVENLLVVSLGNGESDSSTGNQIAHCALELKSVDDRTKTSAVGSGVAMNNPTVPALTHVLNNKHELPFSVSVENLLVSWFGISATTSDFCHSNAPRVTRSLLFGVTRVNNGFVGERIGVEAGEIEVVHIGTLYSRSQ